MIKIYIHYHDKDNCILGTINDKMRNIFKKFYNFYIGKHDAYSLQFLYNELLNKWQMMKIGKEMK